MVYEYSSAFAQKQDKADNLAKYREQFIFPQHNGKNVIYFTGNSLGLQPIKAKQALIQELNDWGQYGVEGHFLAKNPWVSYHEQFSEPLARLVGAKSLEVVAMNGLTSNLHFLMATFYKPSTKRYKILCEAKAFPSDQYALETQVKFHDLNPDKTIVEINPREGTHLVNEEDILDAIEKQGDSLALVMIGSVNYLTGQVFDMKKIAEAAHKVGAIVGFDLAHAIGNIKLNLHSWDVDFAAWCSYKYLNSGPGSVGGIYVNEKHCKNKDLIRLAGWWGHDKTKRFLMEKGFNPMQTAESWQVSNAPVFSMAIHKSALDIFDEAGFDNLIEKRDNLTGYLEFVINRINESFSENKKLEIITPSKKNQRGAQLSVVAHGIGRKLFDRLTEQGVVADWREPNVIRLAPVPLYNSYEDIYQFGVILQKAANE